MTKLRFTRIIERNVSYYNQNCRIILKYDTHITKKLRLVPAYAFLPEQTMRDHPTEDARISYKMFLIVKL